MMVANLPLTSLKFPFNKGPGWLAGKFFVRKICDSALSLIFGAFGHRRKVGFSQVYQSFVQKLGMMPI